MLKHLKLLASFTNVQTAFAGIYILPLIAMGIVFLVDTSTFIFRFISNLLFQTSYSMSFFQLLGHPTVTIVLISIAIAMVFSAFVEARLIYDLSRYYGDSLEFISLVVNNTPDHDVFNTKAEFFRAIEVRNSYFDAKQKYAHLCNIRELSFGSSSLTIKWLDETKNVHEFTVADEDQLRRLWMGSKVLVGINGQDVRLTLSNKKYVRLMFPNNWSVSAEIV